MDVGTVLSAAQTLLTVLDSQKLKEMCSIFGYKSELDGLKDTVSTINAVLRDAETKQELSAQEQKLIEDLKGAVYEADDLLDEFVTLVERKKLTEGERKEHLLSFFRKVGNLGVAFKMSKGIKKIKKRLDAIANNNQFSFQLDLEPIRKRRPETCSYVNTGEIVGRDDDLEKIVGMLLDSNVQKDVSFLSIVGIGGLGKTALAQLVYNDPRVTSAFPLRLWVCVSDQDQVQLDIEGILRKILALATSKKHEDSPIEQVQIQLRHELASNKYLLVLDDVWTEKRDQWGDLVKYLIGGERGSRVIITTRSQETSTIIGDGLFYGLQGLSVQSSWRLFEMSALGSHQSNPSADLVKIGQEIVDGCAGVPLAIKVAGSFLYGQDKSKWLSFQHIGVANIRQSKNGIMPVLKLSYYNLESSLKNCFSYCALFPKDFEIEKDMLISLWMAQGYIVPLDKGQSIEAAGEEYFSILLKRCFFQDIKKNKNGEIISCKIHDLMHDLAQSVLEKEINATMNTLCGKLDENVRHVSIARGVYGNYSLGKTHIRSFLNVNDFSVDLDPLFLEPLLAHCRCLRALHLSALGIRSLPHSIGELLHLRYLNLSGNHSFEVLPKSITKLYNLETLNVQRCNNLRELPEDLSKLAKLRILDISNCDKLINMPKGMGKLACLHTLSNFKVDGGSSSTWKQWYDGFGDLKALIKNLKGHLDIEIRWPKKATDAVKEGSRREESNLNSKEHLHSIKITFEDENSVGRVYNDEARRLMEELLPHINPKKLEILGYCGLRMPGWAALLPNLVHLYLSHCQELEYLPCLGSLRHLKDITLVSLDKLEYIEEDDSCAISGSNAEGLSYYPSLEKLELRKLPKMKGWRRYDDDYLHQLGYDSGSSCKGQLQLLPVFAQLKSLHIFDCRELTCLPQCPRLEDLYLLYFNKRLWQTRRKMNNSSSQFVPRLGKVRGIDNVAWLCSLPIETSKCVEYLSIKWDSEVESLEEVEELFRIWSSSLRHLEIGNCSNLRNVMSGGLEYLTALEELALVDCPNLKLSEEDNGTLMPCPSLHSLRTLKLESLPKLVNLPNWMQFLRALQSLEINDCPALKSMPNWMPELNSLSELWITYCSESLERRCQKNPPGEDWPYIRHIASVECSTTWFDT